MNSYPTSLVWFRRDLRSYDHAALSRALQESERVYCAFVFDTDILDLLKDRADRRLEFIWHSLKELHAALVQMGGGLIVRQGRQPRLRAASHRPRCSGGRGIGSIGQGIPCT
jgi:deoxyribodipyrimidine photo-lyase